MRGTVREATRLAALAAVALLAEPLTGVVDTMLAGRLGVDQQAALAVGASMATTATWLVTPILFAQTTEVARLRALGDNEDAAATTRSGLIAAAAFGLVLCLVLAAIAIISSAGSREYLLARAAGLPVMAVVMAGYGALRGANAVHVVSVLALCGAMIHVVLAFASVAWTSLGIGGLGLASAVSQCAVACLLLPMLRRRALLGPVPVGPTRRGSAVRQSAGEHEHRRGRHRPRRRRRSPGHLSGLAAGGARRRRVEVRSTDPGLVDGVGLATP